MKYRCSNDAKQSPQKLRVMAADLPGFDLK